MSIFSLLNNFLTYFTKLFTDFLPNLISRFRRIEIGSSSSSSITNDDIFDKEYDVVVVGSGLAGLTCALSAADGGLSVAIIEKRSALGGNTSIRSIKPHNSLSPSDDYNSKELQLKQRMYILKYL